MRKVWHQMRREGFDVARCTVERLMRELGIQGVVRGKAQKTTRPDKALPYPRDKVNRQTVDAVEWETLKWVDWFNNRRLLQPIGNIPPTEAEEKFYQQCNEFDKVA